jgi:hypothetical protein
MQHDYVQMNQNGKKKLTMVYVLVVHLLNFRIQFVLIKKIEILKSLIHFRR